MGKKKQPSEKPVPLYYTFCDRCREAKPSRITHHPVIVAGSSGQEQQLICEACIEAAELELQYRLRTFGSVRRPSNRAPVFALVQDEDGAERETDEDEDEPDGSAEEMSGSADDD